MVAKPTSDDESGAPLVFRRRRMTPDELKAWSDGLKQLKQKMRADPGWKDIDVDEELHAMREERLARFD